MNSPSLTSQPSVNLPIAISSGLSRSVFASLTSPIKFGLLPSYPHILTVAGLSCGPWMASALQMSTCTWHVPGVQLPSPTRAPQTALCSGSQRFPSFVSVPSGLPCTSGILFPFSLPWFPSFMWPPPPPDPLRCQPPAAPAPRSSLLRISGSRILVCCWGLLFFSFWDWEISILRMLMWGEKHFVQVDHNPRSCGS